MIDDDLDASLQDFEHRLSPTSLRQSSALPSEPATEDDYQYGEEERGLASDADSVNGGYSPPAWRRLGNGNRSSGFWRGPSDDFLPATAPMASTRDSSPGFDDTEDESVLDRAIHTRLPRGSLSPDKGRSVSPDGAQERTLKVELPSTIIEADEPIPDNCECCPLRSWMLRAIYLYFTAL